MNAKDFGFKDQIARGALPVSSNIAEDYERRSSKEFINFLSYARGLSGELRSQIYICIEIGYIERQVGKPWIQESEEILRMISGLMKSRAKSY